MANASSSIDLLRTRSALEVINVSSRFLRSLFAPLTKGLIVLAGPASILSSTLGTFIGLDSAGTPPTPSLLLLVEVLSGVVGGVIAAAISIGAVEAYPREGRDALTLRRLWDIIRTHGPALFGRQLQLGLVMGTGVVLSGLLGVLVFGPSGAGGAVTTLLAVGWVLYVCSHFLLLLPGEVDPDRSTSFRRCLDLVHGRAGQTLGVLLLAGVVSVVVFSAGWIPQFLLGVLQGVGVGTAGPVGPVLVGLVAGVANVFSSAIHHTALTFQYYNLVEQQEQVSPEQEIEEVEQNASRVASGGHESAHRHGDAGST